MSNSINITAGMRANTSALNSLSKALQQTQNRLSTGKKINSVLDNPAVFYQASALNQRVSALDRLLDAMGQGMQTIAVANQGVESSIQVLEQMKETAQKAQSLNELPTRPENASTDISQLRTLDAIAEAGELSTEPQTELVFAVDSIFDGKSNTAAMLEAYGSKATAAYNCNQYCAAGVAADDENFGVGQWYLPAFGEMIDVFSDDITTTPITYSKGRMVYSTDIPYGSKMQLTFDKTDFRYYQSQVHYSKQTSVHYKAAFVTYDYNTGEERILSDEEYNQLSTSYYKFIYDYNTGREIRRAIDQETYQSFITEHEGTYYSDDNGEYRVMNGLGTMDIWMGGQRCDADEYAQLDGNYYVLGYEDWNTGRITYQNISGTEYQAFIAEHDGTEYYDENGYYSIYNGTWTEIEDVEIDEDEFKSLWGNYYRLTTENWETGCTDYQLISKAEYDAFIAEHDGTYYDFENGCSYIDSALYCNYGEDSITEEEYNALNGTTFVLHVSKEGENEAIFFISAQEFADFVNEHGSTQYEDLDTGEYFRVASGVSQNKITTKINEDDYNSIKDDYYILSIIDNHLDNTTYQVISKAEYDAFIAEHNGTTYDDDNLQYIVSSGVKNTNSWGWLECSLEEYNDLLDNYYILEERDNSGQYSYQVITKSEYDAFKAEHNGSSYNHSSGYTKVYSGVKIDRKFDVSKEKCEGRYYLRSYDPQLGTSYSFITLEECLARFGTDSPGYLTKIDGVSYWLESCVKANLTFDSCTKEEYEQVKDKYYVYSADYVYDIKEVDRQEYERLTALGWHGGSFGRIEGGEPYFLNQDNYYSLQDIFYSLREQGKNVDTEWFWNEMITSSESQQGRTYGAYVESYYNYSAISDQNTEGRYIPFTLLENKFNDAAIKPAFGDIMYSDLTYGSVDDYDSAKIAVGVVTWVSDDGASARVIGLKSMYGNLYNIWQEKADVAAIKNVNNPGTAYFYGDESTQSAMFDGKANTQAILEQFGTDASAAYACNQFYAPGVAADDVNFGQGTWYLPASGEVLDVEEYYIANRVLNNISYHLTSPVGKVNLTYSQKNIVQQLEQPVYDAYAFQLDEQNITYYKNNLKFYKYSLPTDGSNVFSSTEIGENDYLALVDNAFYLQTYNKNTGKYTYAQITRDDVIAFKNEHGSTYYSDSQNSYNIGSLVYQSSSSSDITQAEYDQIKDRDFYMSSYDKQTGYTKYNHISKQEYDAFIAEHGHTRYEDNNVKYTVYQSVRQSLTSTKIDCGFDYPDISDQVYYLITKDNYNGRIKIEEISQEQYDDFITQNGKPQFSDTDFTYSVTCKNNVTFAQTSSTHNISKEKYDELKDVYYLTSYYTSISTGISQRNITAITKQDYDAFIAEHGKTSYKNDGYYYWVSNAICNISGGFVDVTEEELNANQNNCYLVRRNKTTSLYEIENIDLEQYNSLLTAHGSSSWIESNIVYTLIGSANERLSSSSITAEEYDAVKDNYIYKYYDKNTKRYDYSIITEEDYLAFLEEHGRSSYSDSNGEYSVEYGFETSRKTVAVTFEEYENLQNTYLLKDGPAYSYITQSDYDAFIAEHNSTSYKDSYGITHQVEPLIRNDGTHTSTISEDEYNQLKDTWFYMEIYDNNSGDRTYQIISKDEYEAFYIEHDSTSYSHGNKAYNIRAGVYQNLSSSSLSEEEFVEVIDNCFYKEISQYGNTTYVRITKDEYEAFINEYGSTSHNDDINHSSTMVITGWRLDLNFHSKSKVNVALETLKKKDANAQTFSVAMSSTETGAATYASHASSASKEHANRLRAYNFLENKFADNVVKPVVGDVMYSDLTYGSANSYDGSKIAVGVVTWVSDDGASAKIVNLKDISSSKPWLNIENMRTADLPKIENIAKEDLTTLYKSSNRGSMVERPIEPDPIEEPDAQKSAQPTKFETYTQQFSKINNSLKSILSDSAYGGVDLLHGQNLKVQLGEKNEHLFELKGLELEDIKMNNWQTQEDITETIAQIDRNIAALQAYAQELSNTEQMVQIRQNFNDAMRDILQSGIDELTLTDMDEDTANYLAMQTRQQLAVNALALAAQSNNAVLKLFR